MKNIFQGHSVSARLFRCMALFLTLGAAASANAKSASGGAHESSDTAPVDSGFFVGGGISYQTPSHGNIDPTINYVIGLGYQFNKMFALEYDYTEPVDNQNGYKDGYQYTAKVGPITTVVKDEYYEYRTQSVYGIFRTPGTIYFKAKLGATYKDYDTTPSNKAVNDASGVDPSGGIGIGVRSGHGLLELEYTHMDSSFVNINGYSIAAYLVF